MGIIFIVIAICLPLAALPFLSGYSKEKSIFGNLYGVAIEIRKDSQARVDGSGTEEGHRPTDFSRMIPKRIPLRFFLAVTLIFLYMGIIRIDRARRREYDRTHGFGPEG
ncbi:MAG: hypothetical protein ABSE25_13730 [Syntrophorhabdales bacterium]